MSEKIRNNPFWQMVGFCLILVIFGFITQRFPETCQIETRVVLKDGTALVQATNTGPDMASVKKAINLPYSEMRGPSPVSGRGTYQADLEFRTKDSYGSYKVSKFSSAKTEADDPEKAVREWIALKLQKELGGSGKLVWANITVKIK